VTGPAGRLLLVVTDTNRGGASNKLARLSRAARARGWTVMMVSVMPAGPVLDDLTADGFTTSSLDARSPLDGPRVVRRLRRLLRTFHPDVVQAALWHANLAARVAVRGTGAPVVCGHESLGDYLSGWQTAVDRRTLGPVAAHYAVSDAVADRVARRDRVPRARITVIRSGLDVDEWQSPLDKAVARARLGLPTDAPVVGWAGRIEPVKHVSLLVDAVVRLDGWWLVVIGDGSDADAVRAAASRAGVVDRVVFTGEVADVRPALAALDVFALVSRTEGLGLALLEAMATGLPVVATDVGGVPEVVTAGHDGLLVPEDAGALAVALAEARSRPDLGARARQTVATRFSEGAMVDAFVDLWTRVRADASRR
jgi:glycosyltransferase involved in cell wall biosynthesis